MTDARTRWWNTLRPRSVAAIAAAIALVTALVLKSFGRDLWCKLGDVALSTWDTAGAHLSQHVLNPYSFTHVEHGVLFYAGLALFCRKVGIEVRFLAALALAGGWEILENSSFIIDRYREQTVDAGYYGDSVVNALSDIGCAALGFWFAARFRWYWSVGMLLAFEIGLALTIRDNLFLNIVMLIVPLDRVLEWQRAR